MEWGVAGSLLLACLFYSFSFSLSMVVLVGANDDLVGIIMTLWSDEERYSHVPCREE